MRLAERHGKSIKNWQRFRIQAVWDLLDKAIEPAVPGG